jgi:hypothetical protein
MYRRSTNATLSLTEFASLRRMANGSASTIPSAHRNLLISMRLVCFDGLAGLVLTELGRQRLECRDLKAWDGGCAPPPPVPTVR